MSLAWFSSAPVIAFQAALWPSAAHVSTRWRKTTMRPTATTIRSSIQYHLPPNTILPSRPRRFGFPVCVSMASG